MTLNKYCAVIVTHQYDKVQFRLLFPTTKSGGALHKKYLYVLHSPWYKEPSSKNHPLGSGHSWYKPLAELKKKLGLIEAKREHQRLSHV